MERKICFTCHIFIVLFCSVYVATETTHYPGIRYMKEECNHTEITISDMRLQLTFEADIPLKVNWTCQTTVSAEDAGRSVLVSYIDLNTEDSRRCRKNSLKIIDTNGTVLNGVNGDCGTIRPTNRYISSGRSLKFEFHTDDSTQTGNFDLLLTPVVLLKVNESCPDSTFRCHNNRCVSIFVICNGFNDCGDNSDEVDKCATESTLIVIGIAVLLVASVVISLVIFLLQNRRRKYKRLSRRGDPSSQGPRSCRDQPDTTGYQQYS